MVDPSRGNLAKTALESTWPALAALIVALAVAAWLILRIRARFRENEDPAEEHRRLLLQMGELRREGGLSDEEYRSIQGRLIEPVDHSMRPVEPQYPIEPGPTEPER